MPVRSREKWAGRARKAMGKMKHRIGGLTYRYKRATAGRGLRLEGMIRETRGKIREKLFKARIKIIP